MSAPSGKLFLLLSGLSLQLAGCADDTEARLQKALGEQGIKSVRVTEAQVTATCASGATSEVPASELERNFLGMAKATQVTAVGRKLLKDCDAKDQARAKEAQAKAMIVDEAKRLEVNITGLDDATAKIAICEKLTAALPAKDPERTVQGVQNTQRWGCAAPPPPPEPVTGAWVVEEGKPEGKKAVSTFLRLQNDAGEKLTVRCTGSKTELYLQPASPAKKGTKVVEATADKSRKAMKWKVKPSTDGKALFFPDLKSAFASLEKATEITVVVPVGKKGANSSAFSVKGFAEAKKKLPTTCR